MSFVVFVFFDDTAPAEIYTLSLHDALPILAATRMAKRARRAGSAAIAPAPRPRGSEDRKSTRLNSSHPSTSYAVFCLKKKNDDHLIYGPCEPPSQDGVLSIPLHDVNPHDIS